MTDRPILFSAPMVRALLEGRKTQTRRVLKPQPSLSPHHEPVRVESRGGRRWVWMVHTDRPAYQFATGDWLSPYAPGDRLWVREAWRTGLAYEDLAPSEMGGDEQVMFEAEGATERWTRGSSEPGRLRPGMHMPRWASRITLIVTDVCVQRMQEINETDALAEGVSSEVSTKHTRVAQFKELWNGINEARGFGWGVNPWVVAVTFTVEKRNIDKAGQ